MELLGTGNFFRSAEMEYISLIMQEHLAHDSIERLGELGSVQFTDLNGDLTAFKRYYTPLVRRCDEMEKKLRFFEEEMKAHGVVPEKYSAQEFKSWADNQRDSLSHEHRGMGLLDYWESVIGERFKDYNAIKGERDKTATALYMAVQRRHVIEKASDFFLVETRGGGGVGLSEAAGGRGRNAGRGGGGAGAGAGAGDVEVARSGGGGGGDGDDMSFKHIAGIIGTEDKVRFARIVFRASSGHAVVRFADIAGELVDAAGVGHTKSVFAIFYRGRTLTGKLDRICTAFGAHQHDVPSFANDADVVSALEDAKAVIGDAIAWLEQERSTSATTLRHLSLLVRKWRSGILREKAVYHTLNMFTRNPERGTVSAQAWVLKTAVAHVRDSLQDVHTAAAQGGRVQPFFFEGLPKPPTHFPTNKITRVFQGIVDTYGVPRYREANPALFSIATFPFLFGVMYGDIGHGTLLTLFGGWMIYKEAALLKGKMGEIFAMAFGGRYMLFMMGIFSIYCGLIYNDLFSLGTSSFGGTLWKFPEVNGTVAKEAVFTGKTPEDIYPFGIDPIWHNSENELLFFNSLKMKMAVVFGIVQMTFGLLLKVSNAMYFKSAADLWLEAVPQVVFMVVLFGYMVFLILFKWSTDWSAPGAGAPPSLIDTMINIALKPGTVLDPMFAGQASLQLFILFLVFVSVPIMLFGKPVANHYFSGKHGAGEEAHGLLHASDGGAIDDGVAHAPSAALGDKAAADGHGHGHGAAAPAGGHGAAAGHEEHGFGEAFIHQAIETIEFVLGSVSNTASYLRLWALSLAHSQLATVFWERALVASIEMNSWFFVIIGYAVWAAMTFGVLMGMDVLECFLHALRLHWVEFQNKFYKADGYKFTAFSFAEIEEAADEAAAAK